MSSSHVSTGVSMASNLNETVTRMASYLVVRTLKDSIAKKENIDSVRLLANDRNISEVVERLYLIIVL